MATRVVVVAENSAILGDESTEVLHKYDNGEVLVRTEAEIPGAVASDGGETLVRQGLRLPGKDVEAVRVDLEELDADERIVAYVELIGPVDRRWLGMMKDLGVEALRFQPEHTYLSRGTVAAFRRVAEQPFVLDVKPLVDDLKRQQAPPEVGEELMWLVLESNRDEAPALIEELDRIPGVDIDRHQELDAVSFYVRVKAEVDSEGHNRLIEHPRVLATEQYVEPRPEDEVAGLIVAGQYNASGVPRGSYLRWLEDHGINGRGITIGIVDNGVDVSHGAFAGRITELDGGLRDWHGTFVAGHAAGNYLDEKDGQGFIYGIGVAPAAEVLAQDKGRATTALCRETTTERGPSGVPGTIQNNSWGQGTDAPMDYSYEESTWDAMVRDADPGSATRKPLTVCFSAGNSGVRGLTRPKAAKNVIVTGNSENLRPDVGSDGGDNIDDVYNTSSEGNCDDGRIRPHVVAPGEWTASANFDSHPGELEYISAALTWGGGTSGASPKTAGACALLAQWWRRHNYDVDPSPAMLRALVVNGAVDTGFNGPIPNRWQGWGRLNLENSMGEGIHRTYVDQSLMLGARGDQYEWQIAVSDPTKPVRITLAWTDPPGSAGTGTRDISAIVNKLVLEVEASGEIYRGNNFQNGWSVAAPVARRQLDGWDNLQNVYLRAGVAADTIRVVVRAVDITTDCLTGLPDNPQQDFALVIHNGFPDEGYTPADMFLVVDDGTGAGGSDDGEEDYWDDSSGSSDGEEEDFDWWWENDATGDEGSEDADEDSWWSWGSSDPETERASETTPAPARREGDGRFSASEGFARELEAGIDLVASLGAHRVAMPPARPAETGDPELVHVYPADEREDAPGQVLGGAVGSLHDKLAALMEGWAQYGGRADDGAIVRRRVAVVVVGAGTRISARGLAALRRLAFLGQLYLVSDDPGIVRFLAQRIHLARGVQYRLALDPSSLAELVRDTLAEAAGAQELEVRSEAGTPGDDGARVSVHRFHIVDADERITIHIGLDRNEELPQVRLARPQQAPFSLGPGTRRRGITVTTRRGAMQIDINRAGLTGNALWAGEWELGLRQAPDTAAPARVCVWASGRMRLALRRKDVPAGAGGAPRPGESERSLERDLVSVSATAGAGMNRVQIEPRIIDGGGGRMAESARTVDVGVQRLRSDGVRESETARPSDAVAPALGAWVPARAAEHGATVVELVARTRGSDAAGNPFYRRLRTSLVHLEPRSAWRLHMQQRDGVVVTHARIAAVEYDGADVAGLLLQQGHRQRYVHVPPGALRDQLEELELTAPDLHFAVQGDRLLAVIRFLQPGAQPAGMPEAELAEMDYDSNRFC